MIGCWYNSFGLCLLMVSQEVSEVQVPSCTSQGCFSPGHVSRLAGVLLVSISADLNSEFCQITFTSITISYTQLWDVFSTGPILYHRHQFILLACLTLLSHSEMLPECDEQLLVWPTQMGVRRWQVNTSALTPCTQMPGVTSAYHLALVCLPKFNKVHRTEEKILTLHGSIVVSLRSLKESSLLYSLNDIKLFDSYFVFEVQILTFLSLFTI